MASSSSFSALFALLLLLPASATAGGRGAAALPPEVAAERVLQLSPGSGVVPGYHRQRTVRPYQAGQVIFQGNLPVGVMAADGSVQPLGSFRDRRETGRRTGYARVEAAPRHAVLGVTARRVEPQAVKGLDPVFLPQRVAYDSPHPAGTIVIDTRAKFLYRVEGDGTARRYGVGVGKEGFGWTGSETITRKAEWPGWTPPAEMIAREQAKGRMLPAHMPGGPENPLGARALYLGSTLYRIHGTNQPWTIGQAVSSGCIRMRNEDVIDLYGRTVFGARVIVL